ncbi:MAG: class I SAM-dependent methyltransferase, partial [Planctomycetota bacterium]
MATGAENFGLDPATYDLFVDWPKRLANEGPFYRELFERVGAARVLDAACGTGRHAALFHSWGLAVEGTDLSPAMIARARELHGESDTLRWGVRPFTEPPDPPGSFDAAICVGNSLSLAPDRAAAARGVHALLAALRPGGVCVIHVLNLWRVAEGPLVWQKVDLSHDAADTSARWRVLIKTLHRVGDRGHLSFAELQVAGGRLIKRFDTAVTLGLTAEELADA